MHPVRSGGYLEEATQENEALTILYDKARSEPGFVI
jgi:hypothetical protein